MAGLLAYHLSWPIIDKLRQIFLWYLPGSGMQVLLLLVKLSLNATCIPFFTFCKEDNLLFKIKSNNGFIPRKKNAFW